MSAHDDATCVRVTGLRKDYRRRRSRGTGAVVRAVDGVTFTIDTGETLAIVGESGAGKTTLARAMLRVIEPTAGRVDIAVSPGAFVELTALDRRALRAVRRHAQMVFQDPYGSLDPRLTVREIVTEPLRVHGMAEGGELDARARELIELVGLRPDQLDDSPRRLSGGERQRTGIARAIATRPRFVIADEPVAALDVSVQGQILNCLRSLQRELSLTVLLISHDLAVVNQMADRVAVMHRGRIVEIGPTATIFDRPEHPHTKRLIAHARRVYNPTTMTRRHAEASHT